MGDVFHLNLPKKPQNWFIAGDFHSKHVHKPSLEILKKHALTLPERQRNLIINGDFLDLPFLMPKNPDFQDWYRRQNGMDEFFVPQYQEEIEWGNAVLDDLCGVFDKIIFIEGNHDVRIKNFAREFAPFAYKPEFDLVRSLKLQDRNIGWINYNDWLDFGKLSITHGMFHGTTAHKKHYEACGARNVVFGHIHTAECKSFMVRGDTCCSWSLPAMCNLSPDYIKNGETCWQNGYGSFLMRPDGKFNLNIHLVIDGKLGLSNGDILDATT